MKLLASALALELILALGQRRAGARLAELASATGAPLSSAQRAMRLLRVDRLVTQRGDRRPQYFLVTAHPALNALVQLAFASLPRERTVAVLARSNPAIEFAAADGDGYITVTSPTADPRDVLAFEDALGRLRSAGQIDVLRLEHHEAVTRARGDPPLRSRIERARIVKGTPARSFPGHDRSGRRRRRARRDRGRLERLFPKISRRALSAIARKHGLRRMRLFGSGARGDLGPVSDVDVLVEPAGRSRLSLAGLARLESDLEEIFERHVDLVTPGGLRTDVREAVEREGMTVYGRA